MGFNFRCAGGLRQALRHLVPLRSLLLRCLDGLLLHVRLEVKVRKQSKHKEILRHQDNDDEFRVIAGHKVQHHPVQGDEEELDNLQLRYVLLPPQIVLVLGIKCRQQIVTVHDHVHETVERSHEDTVTPRKVLNAVPGQQDHSRVMVHVQEGDLVLFLAQHKEYLRKGKWSLVHVNS